MFVGHGLIFMGARGPKSLGTRMALNDTKLQRLQAKERSYQLADGGGRAAHRAALRNSRAIFGRPT